MGKTTKTNRFELKKIKLLGLKNIIIESKYVKG